MKSTYIVLIVCLIISIKLDSNKADYGFYGFPRFWQGLQGPLLNGCRPHTIHLTVSPPPPPANPMPMPMQYFVPVRVPVPVPVPVEPSEPSEPPKTRPSQLPQPSRTPPDQPLKSPQPSQTPQSSRLQQTPQQTSQQSTKQSPQQSAEARKAKNDNIEKSKAAMKSMADKYAPAVNKTMNQAADYDRAILKMTKTFVGETLDNAGDSTVEGMKELTNPSTEPPEKNQ
ncbi:putative uncharacterized protein DDB_G0290521 [Panonychus citri]|uniref:putative uncharacterized protein DDB_G0290521 n=1 Tax=Panonychus citri TaxID=50023 RepID=UPI00230748A0|nr:putative uncharacterized protein DDB_G0290521 [Panonychus citri]